MRKLRWLFLLPIAAWLLTGIAEIGPKERAVVRRFGRVVATPGPGLWIGLPWGLDRLDRVPIAAVQRLRIGWQTSEEDPSGQLLTGDQNIVNISLNLDYSVAEGDAALIEYVLQRERSEQFLTREAEAVLAEWVAGRGVDEVLLTGNSQLPRWLLQRLQNRLEAQKLGIRVQQVSVESLSPPESVRTAFEEVNRAQNAIRTQEHRAKQEAELRIKSARADEFRLKQEADSYSENTLTLAKAEAETFTKRLASYRELKKINPDILALIWWDEIGKLLVNLKQKGRIDLLDNHLGADGLDITQMLRNRK